MSEVTTSKLKSYDQIKQLIKDKKIECLHVSDDGEVMHLGVKTGAGTKILVVWFDDYGKEFAVVDTDKTLIRKDFHNEMKILFED